MCSDDGIDKIYKKLYKGEYKNDEYYDSIYINVKQSIKKALSYYNGSTLPKVCILLEIDG